jgi:hypothetical protein
MGVKAEHGAKRLFFEVDLGAKVSSKGLLQSGLTQKLNFR